MRIVSRGPVCQELDMAGAFWWADKADYPPNLSEAVRTAIGQGLRSHYPSPQDLPADLFALVSRLAISKNKRAKRYLVLRLISRLWPAMWPRSPSDSACAFTALLFQN